jgi:hypothetical protein
MLDVETLELDLPMCSGISGEQPTSMSGGSHGSKIMHMLIESRALITGKLSLSDLPEAVTCELDHGHLFRAITATRARKVNAGVDKTGGNSLQLVKFILERMSCTVEALYLS